MKTKVKILLFIVTIILVVIPLSRIQLTDIVNTLIGIDPRYIVIGLVFYVLTSLFRALRFYILLNKQVRIQDIFNVVCIHNMMNNILPARTGEISYIFLLKKYYDTKAGEGIATLLVARVFDFISISLLFFISVFMIKDLPEIMTKGIWFIFIIFVLVVVFLSVLLYYSISFLNSARTIFRKFGLEEKRYIDYILRKGTEMVYSFEKIRSIKALSLIFLLSFIILIFNYILVYILLRSMNILLPFQLVIIGATFMLLTTVLPIYGVGGFGTTEGFWILVFVPLGLKIETAIVSGFSYHIIIFLYFLILGAYGTINVYLNGGSKK